ncbi:MAG: addiction module protein [Marinobacter sp.]|uniref:addiction module protein n=1 Tax=Marinobacter sp. TaxID=50741 RepID=UPI003F9A8960
MQNIDRMTDLEKVHAMEQLWESLTRDESLPEPPEWHRGELQRRTAKIQEGKVNYTNLDELKERSAQG